MAKCKFCSKEIVWMKEGRRNKPVEVDGGAHECIEMRNSLKSTKVIEPSDLSAEVIARYENAINEQAKLKKKKKKS